MVFKKKARPAKKRTAAVLTRKDSDSEEEVVATARKAQKRAAESHVAQTLEVSVERTSRSADSSTYRTKAPELASSESKPKTDAVPKPANVKHSIQVDHQLAVCKDYKELGYCGFGDTCIYLHDRGDYKTGAEVEQEFRELQKRNALKRARREKGEENVSSDEDDMDLHKQRQKRTNGFQRFLAAKSSVVVDAEREDVVKCGICRKDPPTQRVKTLCKHSFCMRCAIAKAASGKCYTCGAPTKGVFNSVK